MPEEAMRDVPVEELIPFVGQSREAFDEAELERLAEDIKARGQLQAGVAWFDPGRGKLILICGERRWRALKLAKLPTMAVRIVAGTLTPGQMLAMNLAENIQRASLNPIERGKAFRRLAQLDDLTARQVAERMHVSDATVSRELALLELPEELQAKVASGELAASAAYHLTRLPDDGTRQAIAEQVIRDKLSRSSVEALVNGELDKKPSKPRASRLACRLEGGISLTLSLSSGQPLTWDELLTALDQVRKEARKLCDRGEEVTALARVLRAS